MENVLCMSNPNTAGMPPMQKRVNNDLQLVLNIIRGWVFDQKTPFQISDIYAQPELSTKLAVTKHNMHLIDEALIVLRCTTQQDHMNTPIKDLVFVPPKITHVNRDCLYT